MTKEELLKNLKDDVWVAELAIAEIPEEQVALVVDMYDKHEERIAHYVEVFKQRREEWWEELEPYYEEYRRLFTYMDTFPYDGGYAPSDLVTAKARDLQLQQLRIAFVKEGWLGSPEQRRALYDSLTPRVMKFGRFLSEWVRGAELDQLYPEGLWAKTIYFFAICEIFLITEGEFTDLTEEEQSAALYFADNMVGANKSYCGDTDFIAEVDEQYPGSANLLGQTRQFSEALEEIERNFQNIKVENQRLERQLNRNKNISLAIRDLLMTRHDRDFQFRYKYQWIGVYEVMGEQHLLPDNSVATFCRLCNDPKGTSYFLPEVDDELQGTNLYIAGDCYEKKSTYHQMISHGKEDRQREVIDKTKEIFEIFLTQRGVLNKEQ